jgi:hypothetical protein
MMCFPLQYLQGVFFVHIYLIFLFKFTVMNYNSLYSYTKDIINNIDSSIKWFHGRRELITQLKPEDTVAFCLPFISSGSVVEGGGQIAETWEVNVIFYKKDQMPTGINQNDEQAQQVEIQVLSATTDIADEFVRNFNFNEYTDALESASEKLDLLSFSKAPAIKDTAHILTGTVVTMRVQVPDDFDYCA